MKACRTDHHAHNHAMTDWRGRNDKATYLPTLSHRAYCIFFGNKTPKSTKKYPLQTELKRKGKNTYNHPSFTHLLTVAKHVAEIGTETKPAVQDGEAACLIMLTT